MYLDLPHVSTAMAELMDILKAPSGEELQTVKKLSSVSRLQEFYERLEQYYLTDRSCHRAHTARYLVC